VLLSLVVGVSIRRSDIVSECVYGDSRLCCAVVESHVHELGVAIRRARGVECAGWDVGFSRN
jgi:hypothetical protein